MQLKLNRREVRLADDRGDQRSNQILYQRCDDGAECRTHNYCNGQVQDIAPHDELLEAPHDASPFPKTADWSLSELGTVAAIQRRLAAFAIAFRAAALVRRFVLTGDAAGATPSLEMLAAAVGAVLSARQRSSRSASATTAITFRAAALIRRFFVIGRCG
jgi:hypothetical protein